MLRNLYFQEERTFRIFTLPFWIVTGSLAVFPFFYMVYISLTNWNLAKPFGTRFVGIENYIRLLEDPDLGHAFMTTLVFIFFPVAGQMVIGLLVAILLHRKDTKFISWVRALFIIPMVLAPVIVGLLWKAFLNPQTGGLAVLLSAFGLPPLSLFNTPTGAITAITVVSIWEWFPFVMLVVLGTLESLPEEPFEAARVDGASSFQIFCYVTLPLLRPALLLVLSFRIIESMRIFPLIFIMTGGGPGKSTSALDYYAYLNAFVYLDVGYASAIIVVTFIFAVLLCLTLFRDLIFARH